MTTFSSSSEEDDPRKPRLATGGAPLPNPEEVNEFHRYDDSDNSPESHHHTLGIDPNQASFGDHTHDGRNSKVITGFLPVGGKAADTELFDGIDSSLFVKIGSSGVTNQPHNMNGLSRANLHISTGFFNLTGTNTDSPWGAADSRWWFLQVMTHIGGSHWQRQLAWDMTGGTDVTWTRRCTGGDPTLSGSWTAWVVT